MPASGGDPVSVSLSLSLASSGTSKELDKQLVSSSYQVLNSRIEYVPLPSCYQSSVLGNLKAKYTVLGNKDENTNGESATLKTSECAAVIRNSDMRPEPDSVLPTPKLTLFPTERVQLGWRSNFTVGAGMINVGNTCYLNSTLQALFHVPALANWLQSDANHFNKCTMTNGVYGECIICAMAKTLKVSQIKSGSVIKPFLIYNKLKLICKHMVHGQQEDAHEFMRYLMESMEEAFLIRFKGNKLDNYSKETTPLNQIFGGYIRTEVNCLLCRGVSTTFQHFQDLLLDIRRSSTLDDALTGYFQRERLDGEDAYRCERCHKKVSATKKFAIEKPPMVLCIQLKRFSVVGGKINKHVSFTQRLDMARFLCQQSAYRTLQPLTYRLVSIVTHMGSSLHCGHYTAVAQTASGQFYQFDDSAVRPISLNSALDTNAYILIYELERSDHRPSPNFTMTKPSTVTSGTAVVNGSGQKLNNLSRPIGPMLPVNHKAGPSLLPSPNLKVSPGLIGVNHKPSSSSSVIPAVHKACSVLPPAKDRDRVVFGLQPRLVMHIKNGKVCQTTTPSAKSSLVPYDSGESSGSETEHSAKKPDMPSLDFGSRDKTPSPAKQQSTAVEKCELFPSNGSPNKPFLVKSRESLSLSPKPVASFVLYAEIPPPTGSEALSEAQKALKSPNGNIERSSVPQIKSSKDSMLSPSKSVAKSIKTRKVDCVSSGCKKRTFESAVNGGVDTVSVSQTLHVNTCLPSASRGKNLTQSWQVSDVSLHSPSMHSESSNNSVASSTTPWSISDMKRFPVKRMPRTISETTEHKTPWASSPVKRTMHNKYFSDTEVERSPTTKLVRLLPPSTTCVPEIPREDSSGGGTVPEVLRPAQPDLVRDKSKDVRLTKEPSYCNGNGPSNDAYEWVEKTHESLGLVRHNGWNPNNRTDVSSQLGKLSHQGYGTAVNSWTGGRSHVDREVDNERRDNRKRNYETQYDEEFDLGRVKKMKHRENFGNVHPKYNKFDEYQSENLRWNFNKGPYYQSYPSRKMNYKKNRMNHQNQNYRRKYNHHRNYYGAKQERWRH